VLPPALLPPALLPPELAPPELLPPELLPPELAPPELLPPELLPPLPGSVHVPFSHTPLEHSVCRVQPLPGGLAPLPPEFPLVPTPLSLLDPHA